MVCRHSAVTSSGEAIRLLNSMQIPITSWTILHDTHWINVPDTKDVKEIGVDDWAFKEGVTYGSIVVNLETSSFLGLLADREQNCFKEWLESHREVCIVSRDRSTEYLAAIYTTGRPIIEVADRFHLVKNMSDCVTKVISDHYVDYRSSVRPCGIVEKAPTSIQQSSDVQKDVQDNSHPNSREIMFREVKELQAKGGLSTP
jgi:transposase